MHKTKNLNDGYMGSGKLLKRAIKKHGIENFIKEILFIFDNEQDMINKEKELVEVSEQSYNLCEGGKGGFGFINANGLGGTLGYKWSDYYKNHFRKKAQEQYEKWTDEDWNNHSSQIKNGIINRKPSFLGKKHTEETKQKMRKSKNIGIKNPSFGSMWITNGIDNRKIKKLETIPDGWYKGRNKGS